MRMAATITVTILAGIPAQAGKTAKPDVVICGQWASDMNLYQAQRMAAGIFADIGVTVQFLYNPRTCPSEAIQISLTNDTPNDLLPGALAYALPYEGAHIQILYDRVRNTVRARAMPYLLAHVLVHEITHILQGTSRHSASGVMKAHWDRKDYVQMEIKPLGFADEDIRLIHQALSSRVSRTPRTTDAASVPTQQMQ